MSVYDIKLGKIISDNSDGKYDEKTVKEIRDSSSSLSSFVDIFSNSLKDVMTHIVSNFDDLFSLYGSPVETFNEINGCNCILAEIEKDISGNYTALNPYTHGKMKFKKGDYILEKSRENNTPTGRVFIAIDKNKIVLYEGDDLPLEKHC